MRESSKQQGALQQDPQFNEGEFQTAGALQLKALINNANDVRGTVSNSLSADVRQRPGL